MYSFPLALWFQSNGGGGKESLQLIFNDIKRLELIWWRIVWLLGTIFEYAYLSPYGSRLPSHNSLSTLHLN